MSGAHLVFCDLRGIRLLALCASALFLSACAQHTSLRIVRLTDVVDDPSSPVAARRIEVYSVADHLIDILTPIAQARQTCTDALGQADAMSEGEDKSKAVAVATQNLKWVTEADDLVRELHKISDSTGHVKKNAAALVGADALAPLSNRLRDCARRASALPLEAYGLAVPQNPDQSVPVGAGPTVRAAAASAKQEAKGLDERAVKASERAQTDIDRLNSSGFIEQGDFVINAADPILNTMDNSDLKYREGTVVYSQIVTDAAGESSVLLVQENPAQFRVLSLKADPTEVLRNTLAAVNQVLQVVAMLGPNMGLPVPKFQLPPIVTPLGTAGQVGVEPGPQRASDPALLSQVRGLQLVTEKDEYKQAVTKLKKADDNSGAVGAAHELRRKLRAALGSAPAVATNAQATGEHGASADDASKSTASKQP